MAMHLILIKTSSGNMIKVDVALYRAFVIALHKNSPSRSVTAERVAAHYDFDQLDALRLVTHALDGGVNCSACYESSAIAAAISSGNDSAGAREMQHG